MDFDVFLKHLVWAVSLLLVLQVVFYFVLEAIDYDAFLLSVLLTGAVLFVVVFLLVWRVFRRSLSLRV